MVMLMALVLFLVLVAIFLLHGSAPPKAMEGIPGTLGWPIVGESFSFISEFSSPAGIFSFMNKRQQR